MWQQLINTALLGTDKISFDEKLLPESIRGIVEQISENDKEARFLKIASLVAFYEDAGQQPKLFEGEIIAQKQEENQPMASQKFLAILDEIVLLQTQFRNHLLDVWLDKLIEKQQVCSAKKTVMLLGLSENLPKKFHQKITKVLGRKGLDLWALKTNYMLEMERSVQEIWEEGKSVERRELFISLRNTHAQQAIELLEITWNQESLNDKMVFVETIQQTFRANDEAFLTQILPEFAFKSKERKTQREIRKIITGLLLRIPQSQVHLNTAEALKNYVSQEKAKGILGWVGKENKVIDLRQEEDSFLNLKNVEAIYGLETSPDIAIFTTNQHYWFSYFVEFMPFSFWAEILDKNIESIVNDFISEMFLVKLAGKKTAILLNSMMNNAIHHRNINLARALINVTNIADQLPLLPLFDISEREQYLISNKQLTSLPHLEACFSKWTGTWSADFSSKILRDSYRTVIENNAFLNDKIGLMMCKHLHPSSNNFLSNAKVYPVSAQTYYINYWEKNFVNVLTDSLQIKQKCQTIL